MSIKNFAHALERLHQKRRHLIAAFLETAPLIVGSLTRTKGRCGKPNCACTKQATHDITLLMTSHGHRRTSQLIRKDDVQEVTEQWQRYRSLRKSLTALRELNKEELEILNRIIQERKTTYE